MYEFEPPKGKNRIYTYCQTLLFSGFSTSEKKESRMGNIIPSRRNTSINIQIDNRCRFPILIDISISIHIL
jgi:hypothetical protein